MAALNAFYRDTLELVRLYNTNLNFKNAFNRLFNRPRVTYKGRPLKLYIRLLATVDPQYRQFTRLPIEPDNVGELFERFYLNRLSFQKLERSINTGQSILPEAENRQLAAIEQTPDGTSKVKAFENFISQHEQAEKKAAVSVSPQPKTTQPMAIPPTTPIPVPTAGNRFLRIPRKLKLPVFAEKLINRITTLDNIARVVGGGFGAYIGGVITNSPLGVMAGAGAGVSLPGFIKNGGGQLLGKIGGKAAGAGTQALAGVARINPYVAAAVTAYQYKKYILYIIIGIVAFFLSIYFTSFDNSGSFFPPYQQQIGFAAPVENKDQIKITKTGPTQVDNGTNITYSIKVTYIGSGKADVQVSDQLSDNADFVEAPAGFETPEGKLSGSTVNWILSGVQSNQTQELTLTVHPKEDDSWVSNTANATVLKTTLPPILTSNNPPNQNNCGGKYTLNNPLGNFGDPNCNFVKTPDLYNALKTADAVNADYWFNVVIPCESGYNPNSYADHIQVGTPDVAGAWGLTQMGRGKNGQYDHGDVVWQQQVTNSINYQHSKNNWRYWACAQTRW